MEINTIPEYFGKVITWDTEFAEQEKSKLHIPHGKFVAMGITDGIRLWVYTDKSILPAVFEVMRKSKTWVLQNAVYDLRQMTRFVPNLLDKMPFIWDTELVEHLIRSDYKSYNLDALSRRWLSKPVKKEMYETLGEGTYNLNEVITYMCNDIKVTHEIFIKQYKAIEDDVAQVYLDIESRMIEIISRMTLRDIRVDKEAWLKFIQEINKQIEEKSEQFNFNIASSEQIIQYFRLKHGIKLPNAQTGTLEKYSSRYSEIKDLIELKHLLKLQSTYGESWLNNHVVDKNGISVVRADARVIGTYTGRITYNSPNMQQIPARNYPIYRSFIIAHPDKSIIVVDISQQEPRILAYISKDEHLSQIFIEKQDIHLGVARKIFDNPNLTKANKHERDIGKAINLGIGYGLTAKGMAERTGIPLERAEQIITDYFNSFPNVYNYIITKRQEAKINGYVTTLSGRRIYVNMYSWEGNNVAINAPIQGSGADVLKLWMILSYNKCKEAGLPFPFLMCIHDELVLEVDKGSEPEYIKILQDALDEVSLTLIPDCGYKFEMEYGTGTSWACKK